MTQIKKALQKLADNFTQRFAGTPLTVLDPEFTNILALIVCACAVAILTNQSVQFAGFMIGAIIGTVIHSCIYPK